MNEKHVKTTPTAKEIELQTKFFEEASYMGGTPVLFYPVKNKVISAVSSEFFEYEDPLSIDIIYDERPKISLLKRLNWYTEDQDIQPRIMYIPSSVGGKKISVVRGAKVRVNSTISPNDSTDLFMISQVRTELVSLFYICNVVPFREQQSPDNDQSLNNRWLNHED